jgi:hypothetical protein
MAERRKNRDDDKGHKPGEHHQPERSPDQGAEDVDLDKKDPEREGRTNVDAHEPRDEEAKPRQGQTLRPRERDAGED